MVAFVVIPLSLALYLSMVFFISVLHLLLGSVYYISETKSLCLIITPYQLTNSEAEHNFSLFFLLFITLNASGRNWRIMFLYEYLLDLSKSFAT